jgi:hypothetical protein
LDMRLGGLEAGVDAVPLPWIEPQLLWCEPVV